MTAPYDPRALIEIAQTLETTCVVSAWTAAGVLIETLDVVSLVLTLDEAWAPHVQAEMTLSAEHPERMDPRTGTRITIDLGYRYPGGILDQHRVADLQLTGWSGTSTEGQVDASAHGDELTLLAWVPLGGTSTTYPVGTPVVTIISALLSASIGRLPDVSAPRTAQIFEPLTVGPGVKIWDVIKSLSDQADLWTYADALGTWHVAPRPTSVAQSVVQVTTGPAGIATKIETGLSREDWGNAVALTYGDGQVAYASDPYGPMGTDQVGICAIPVRTSAPWPGSIAASAAAWSILTRTLTRGAAQAITALAAWWVRPGDTITTPDTARVIASRVRFTYPDSLMTITTREA